jgi:hypothetical protein
MREVVVGVNEAAQRCEEGGGIVPLKDVSAEAYPRGPGGESILG